MNTPAHAAQSVQLDPCAPPSLFTGSHPESLVFVPPGEKSPPRDVFANVEEVKQRTAEALKGIELDEIKNCFEPWRIHLYRCIALNGKYFEGD